MDLERNVVLGELTIKDVTHPVELKVMAVREYLDEVGAKMLRCRAIGTVNRRTFGVAEDASRSEGLARFIAEIQEGLDEFIEDDVEISVHVVARAN